MQQTYETANEKYQAIKAHWAATMSLSEAEELSHEMARMIAKAGQKPDLIVGLANGALLPTKVAVRRQGSRYKQRLLAIKNALHIPTGWITWGPMMLFWKAFQNRTSKLETGADTFDFDVRGKSIALIDDCIVTGSSVRHVTDMLKKQGASEVTINALCWCEGEAGDTPEGRPDVFLHRHIQLYPWSANHPALKDYLQWLKRNQLELWE
jgi:hypoxanthine phosphoribosyltransferase